MNRIEQMVQDLSPDGVRFVPLADVGQWFGGGTPSKSRPDYWVGGSIPWVSPKDMGSRVVESSIDAITEAALEGSSTKLVPPTSVVMVVRSSILDHTFPTALVPVPVALNQDMKAIVPRDGVLATYLAHVLVSRGQQILHAARRTGGSVASIDSGRLARFRIPVPPLEVQREIVRVLDEFTQLEAELEAELGARRRQYEYYREVLVNLSGTEPRRARLDELFDLRAGKFISAAEIVSEPDSERAIPCFGGGGLRGYVSSPNQQGDLVLIGRQGALCGNVKRASGEFYATEHSVVVTPKAGVDIRWAFHLLTRMNLNQYASKSAQPGLAVGTLNQLVVDVPSIKTQSLVGSILDRFDALVNDLSIGLPAELAARREQYAYYRDELLSFKVAPA